jgi:uncharacterized OB-fold protein
MRPVPRPDELTAPYWAAASEHRLAIQQCTSCGNYQHPPRVYCLNCHEGEIAFTDVSGAGRVYSHAKVLDSNIPGLEAPYTVIVAELVEQPGLWILSTFAGVRDVQVGDELALTFEDLEPGISLPHLLPPGERPPGSTRASDQVEVRLERVSHG